MRRIYCSAAILFSAQGVQRTVDVLAVIDAPIDDMLKAACRPGGSLTCYALRQPVFVQDLLWGSAVRWPGACATPAAAQLPIAPPGCQAV